MSDQPDLIERTRPNPSALTEWTPDLQQAMLADVLGGRTRRVRSGRRAWPVAVAASTVEGTAPVQDAAGTTLRPDRVTLDDYYAADGWHWSDRVVNGASERYTFGPGWGWSRPDFAAAMPGEPHLLDAFLRARVMGPTSVDEAVFSAISDMLRQEAAPPKVRAAALGVLGLNPKVTVERVPDPQGRPALKATFVDEQARPGVRQSLYIDPQTGLILVKTIDADDYSYHSVVTDREVVDALPASLVDTLGTERIAKEIVGGVVRTFEHHPGPDPQARQEPWHRR